VDVLFYKRSHGQYILVGYAVMAVFLFTIIAMIVSLTKIYCPSDFKQKRTPTVYQNVTQYNNQQQTQPWQCQQAIYIRGCCFLLKVRWTIYFSWLRCYGCVCVHYYAVWRSDKRVDVLFYKRSHGQYTLVGYAHGLSERHTV
jgi:hypothetical protein